MVDWSHARERLWVAGNLVLGAGRAPAHAWVEVQWDALWRGPLCAVVSSLAALAAARPLTEVPQAAGYFRNNAARMRYAAYRAAGYPMGSGTVERGAHTIMHARRRRAGRGWTREHGPAMLAALRELPRERFDRAWQSPMSAAT